VKVKTVCHPPLRTWSRQLFREIEVASGFAISIHSGFDRGETSLTTAFVAAWTVQARGVAGTLTLDGDHAFEHARIDRPLLAGGALVTRTETAFEIDKVGFEQFVATNARQNGFVYGLVTAAMALMTGWMASIVFRKD